MRKIFTKTFFRMLGTAIVGFCCGFLVDSVIFHIDPLFCGIADGAILFLICYALQFKDKNRYN